MTRSTVLWKNFYHEYLQESACHNIAHFQEVHTNQICPWPTLGLSLSWSAGHRSLWRHKTKWKHCWSSHERQGSLLWQRSWITLHGKNRQTTRKVECRQTHNSGNHWSNSLYHFLVLIMSDLGCGVYIFQGFPGGIVYRICLLVQECKKCWFDPWVGEIQWRMQWKTTPLFLPGIFHGQRNLAGDSPCGRKDPDTTEWLSTHTSTSLPKRGRPHQEAQRVYGIQYFSMVLARCPYYESQHLTPSQSKLWPWGNRLVRYANSSFWSSATFIINSRIWASIFCPLPLRDGSLYMLIKMCSGFTLWGGD